MTRLESELKITEEVMDLVSKQITEGYAEEVRLSINRNIDSVTPMLLRFLDKEGYNVKRVADMDDNLRPKYYLVITKKR